MAPTLHNYEIQVQTTDGTWVRPSYASGFNCEIPRTDSKPGAPWTATAPWSREGWHWQYGSSIKYAASAKDDEIDNDRFFDIGWAEIFARNNPGVAVRVWNKSGMGHLVHAIPANERPAMPTAADTTIEQEETMHDPITDVSPLNIKREALIKALQEKLDARVAEREAEQKLLDDARKELVDAIKAFSEDELYSIFKEYYTIDASKLRDAKKDKRFVPSTVQPTSNETELERAVRVLGMADDKTVEVKPTSNLYRLL